MTPVSLLAAISDSAAGPVVAASAASSASRSIRPSGDTGTVIASAAASTEACSTAETRMVRPDAAMPASASALASVPPLVKTICAEATPTRAATASRPCSTSRRAARPWRWIEDGLPVADSAAVTASRACGRIGAVAL